MIIGWDDQFLVNRNLSNIYSEEHIKSNSIKSNSNFYHFFFFFYQLELQFPKKISTNLAFTNFADSTKKRRQNNLSLIDTKINQIYCWRSAEIQYKTRNSDLVIGTPKRANARIHFKETNHWRHQNGRIPEKPASKKQGIASDPKIRRWRRTRSDTWEEQRSLSQRSFFGSSLLYYASGRREPRPRRKRRGGWFI